MVGGKGGDGCGNGGGCRERRYRRVVSWRVASLEIRDVLLSNGRKRRARRSDESLILLLVCGDSTRREVLKGATLAVWVDAAVNQ